MRPLNMIGALALAAALAASAAYAQADAIAQRKAILKEFGAVTPGGMLQGRQPFDLAKARAALETYEKGAHVLPSLFPASAQTGGGTEALPAIWKDKADFEARFAKLATDSRTTRAAIKDEAGFRAEFPKVLANCRGCHDLYRLKK